MKTVLEINFKSGNNVVLSQGKDFTEEELSQFRNSIKNRNSVENNKIYIDANEVEYMQIKRIPLLPPLPPKQPPTQPSKPMGIRKL